MDHFIYKSGILYAEDVAIPDIAASVGTPFYVYSAATLTRHYRLFTEALSPLPRSSVKRISLFSRTSTNWQLYSMG